MKYFLALLFVALASARPQSPYTYQTSVQSSQTLPLSLGQSTQLNQGSQTLPLSLGQSTQFNQGSHTLPLSLGQSTLLNQGSQTLPHSYGQQTLPLSLRQSSLLNQGSTTFNTHQAIPSESFGSSLSLQTQQVSSFGNQDYQSGFVPSIPQQTSTSSENQAIQYQQPIQSAYNQQSTLENQAIPNVRYTQPNLYGTSNNLAVSTGIQDNRFEGQSQFTNLVGTDNTLGVSNGFQDNRLEGQTQFFTSNNHQFGVNTLVPTKPIVQKNIYIHVPPPDTPEEKQAIIQAAVPRTNYKIIFIKAPTVPAIHPKIIQQQLQNQEKTIVYVLVKKPSEQETIKLAGLAPTTPTKPEVYFIKYKARKEIEDVASQTNNFETSQTGYGSPSVASSDVTSVSNEGYQ